ncbi:MAG: hypothetical protein AAGE93_26730 [Bacteroidota bacterium]
MKKLLLYPILLLIFNASCEDPLEGNITPLNTNIGGIELPPDQDHTHWWFIKSTEGVGDAPFYVGTNPDTKSDIYVRIENGTVVDAWATTTKHLAIKHSHTQVGLSGDFTAPLDPIHGEPIAAVLPQIICKEKNCPPPLEAFCHPDPQTLDTKCIHVGQASSEFEYELKYQPSPRSFSAYVPVSL